MSFRQAYHTSCKTGLSGISGFQIHAASPALDREQLLAISADHARYDAPPDAPFEPTPDEIRALPVALRASVVAGVGPVVSRTAYVGREYRGRNGQPDEGRFGNYFCHMVVGRDGGEEPFGGPLAVELWDAAHWSTDEVDGTELPELPELRAGPIALDVVAPLATGAPAGVAAALLEGTLQALVADGPSVMLVDPDHRRAALWIAWLVYALPPGLAGTLTFSTYEGRPGDITGLHVVATTPSCDPGPALTRRVLRVDVSQPAEVTPSLYTRVAMQLLERDSEALAAAVRRVRGTRLDDLGAVLAVVSGEAALVRDEELESVLAVLGGLAATGRIAEVAEVAAALQTSEAADRPVIKQWFELYVAARRSTAGDPARELSSTALVRLVAHIDDLPDDLPPLGEAIVNPAVKGTGAWATAMQDAAGTPRAGRIIKLGIPLGLLGINVPVDGRIAAVLAQDIGLPSAQDAIATIAADASFDHILEQMTVLVLDDVAPGARRPLVELARHEAIRRTVERRAQEQGTFSAQLDWQLLRTALDPSLREDAARALAPLARSDEERRAIRGFWGPNGPTTQQETIELLGAYLDAGVDPWPVDLDEAFHVLMEAPLPGPDSGGKGLGAFLGQRFGSAAASREGYVAWWVAARTPTSEQEIRRWIPHAARGLRSPATELPDARRRELVRIVASTVVRFRRSPDFRWMLDELRDVGPVALGSEMGTAVARRIERAEDKDLAVAHEFAHWMTHAPQEAEQVLPVAFASLSARDVERVSKQFSASGAAQWDAWAENHPRESGRDKIARSLGFGRKDRA